MSERKPAECSFNRGDLLQAIIFDDETEFRVGVSCETIVVTMENGQMAGVPWFEVWKDGKLHSKWNAALVAGVMY